MLQNTLSLINHEEKYFMMHLKASSNCVVLDTIIHIQVKNKLYAVI